MKLKPTYAKPSVTSGSWMKRNRRDPNTPSGIAASVIGSTVGTIVGGIVLKLLFG